MRAPHWFVLAGTSLAVMVLQLAGARPGNIDDAFIALVYAKRIAAGQPFAWNLDDGRVDGFTSLLDVAAKAAFGRVFGGIDLRSAWILSLVLEVAVVAVALRIARGLAGPSRVATAAAVLCALGLSANEAMAEGSSFVLETSLYVLLVLSALATLLFRGDARPVTLALLAVEWVLVALARPEGLVVAALFAAVFWVTRRRTATRAERLAPVAAAGVVLAGYLAWHLLAFGHLAPNTFYAKASDSRLLEIADGANYVMSFGLTPATGLLVVGFVVGPLVWGWRAGWTDDAVRARYGVATLAASTSALTVVLGGGDGYPGGRFMAAPVALELVALALAAVGLRRRAGGAALGALAVCVLQWGSASVRGLPAKIAFMRDWPVSIKNFPCDPDIVATMRTLGIRSVAESDYQRMKFYAEDIHVRDLTGLNDVILAHGPHPGQNLWGKLDIRQAPRAEAEVLQIGTQFITSVPMGLYTTGQLFDNPRVATMFFGAPLPPEAREAYVSRYVAASFPVCKDNYFDVFLRKDVASRTHVPRSWVDGSQRR